MPILNTILVHSNISGVFGSWEADRQNKMRFDIRLIKSRCAANIGDGAVILYLFYPFLHIFVFQVKHREAEHPSRCGHEALLRGRRLFVRALLTPC